MNDLGRRVYGGAAIWLGLVGLAWDDFASVWQPVPKETPGYALLAYLTAALFLIGGMAMQWRRTLKPAALGLAALFGVFALLWARRIVGFPQLFGTWSGTAEQVALVMGGLVAYAGVEPPEPERAALLRRIGRIGFGLCLVAFGISHFLAVKQTAALVPPWLPPGPVAWAYITGVCHIAAGLALLSGIQALLAARLLTAMFLVFEALVWAPQLFTDTASHQVWSGNGVNLALIGAAWVMADMLASRSQPREPA